MKFNSGNKYAYFSEEVHDHFPEPLLDKLDIHLFMHANHRHDKVNGILITGLFSVVG